MGKRSEIFVVSVYLARYNSVKSVVEFVDPLAIQTVSTYIRGIDISRIVEIEFSYQDFFLAELQFERSNFLRKFLYEWLGAKVPYGVNGVQSKAIDVELVEPHERILPVEVSDSVTPRVVEVDCFSPA